MNNKIFEYNYTVKPADIDQFNHVNNVVYLQWVQEAATKHWSKLIENKDFVGYFWVVGRHEIDYIRPAFLNDELVIKTWIGKTEGTHSIRHVEMYKDNKVIAKTKTTWRLLDAKTYKPTPIPENVYHILENA